MESTGGVVRRVMNKPRDIIPRNPAINPDVNITLFISIHMLFVCLFVDIIGCTRI